MNRFEPLCTELLALIKEWEPVLLALEEKTIKEKRNRQNRNIKQITGHLIDSASNNTHRVIHLQYQSSPIIFPDYANLGNNDRWIAIQDYENENWNSIVQLWKYSNLHFVHTVRNINMKKLNSVYVSALDQRITLDEMVTDYPRHFKLHLEEIRELING